MPVKLVEYKSFQGKKFREVSTTSDPNTTPFQVPVIDCTDIFSPELSSRQRVASQVRRAFQDHGILYASNHGVSPALRSAVLDASKQFFDLPLEEKMKLHERLSQRKRGYQYLSERKADEPERKDFREAFKMRLNPQNSNQAGLNWNQWPNPATIPDMESVMTAYMASVLRFCNHFIRIIALALGAAEDVFEQKVDRVGGMSVLHYPPARRRDEEGRAVHSDYSWFTIIDQLSPVPALEALDPLSGAFASVPPLPDTLVVNVGECLERASNQLFMGTVHRVMNQSQLDRYSAVNFFDPLPEAVIRVLESCVDEARPKRYEDIMAGEWNKGLYLI